MAEISYSSNQKASINLSRNTPVALVVGVAGFLGSHICERLLDHRIQVIGVDDFSTGEKENLSQATRESRFHLVSENAAVLSVDVPRLDYVFIVADEGWRVDNILHLAKKYSSKIVFISWIDLYSGKGSLPWFKNTEGHLADFAKEYKLNARVVRLAPVYGPRMNFSIGDPIISLIKSALEQKLQSDGTTLEFSSRALYVEDAVNLIVKSMLSGGTAWKIFDGANYPVKVSEIKQVLLDPVWHENKGFEPTELPPWPTPNLERTQKELHWKPKTNLVESLKLTLTYFKDHDFKPREKLTAKAEEIVKSEEKVIEEIKEEIKIPDKKFKKFPWKGLLVIVIVFYGLVYPLMAYILGLTFLNFQEKFALENLKKENFKESQNNLQSAKGALNQIKIATSPFFLAGELVLGNQVRRERARWDLKEQTLKGMEHLVAGVSSLTKGFKIVSGQVAGDSNQEFTQAQIELQAAESLITPASLELKDENTRALAQFISKTRQAALFLPKFFGQTTLNYLLVVQDSSELRPTGGLISSLAIMSFDNGKLKKITPLSLSDLNQSHGQPPKEIKEDLSQKDWLLKDANFEADFPSSAKQIETFLKEDGLGDLDGVISVDLVGLAGLINQVGEINTPKGKVSSDNLMTKILAEGSKNELLDSLTEELLNRIFFQSANLSGVALSLEKSLNEKHMLTFFNKGDLESISLANKWDGGLTKPNVISVVEANFSGNKANYFLDRNFTLDLTNLKESSASAKLLVNYTNRSQNRIWPGGTYKNRVRIFVPGGSKLNNLKWGSDDLTSKAETISDYNLTAFSLLLTLEPGQTKTLSIDFKMNSKPKELNFLKQPGTDRDPLTIKLPGGKVINTNLSQDQKLSLF